MSNPLRIIVYEDDLDAYDISGIDKHTGFLAESTMRDLIASGFKRRRWTFHNLTLQELFTAIWLLRQPPEDLLKLIDDETSLSRHEGLENSDLDIHLFKQLCDALEQNRSIQELKLEQCDLSAPVIDCCLGRTFSRGLNNKGLPEMVKVAEAMGARISDKSVSTTVRIITDYCPGWTRFRRSTTEVARFEPQRWITSDCRSGDSAWYCSWYNENTACFRDV
ncbi:hypothetical protein LSAT2_025610 [Lamellibrachia satsuma]|nr:hypothetical protein LSAT2_025610 [Lamellibrachia satsuma]